MFAPNANVPRSDEDAPIAVDDPHPPCARDAVRP
jgi:hypothetical protein